MKERYRLLYLIVIMIFSVSLVGGFTFYELYKTAVEGQRNWLANIARSQARLIESVASFDAKFSTDDYPGGAAAATLSQFVDAYQKYKGFGKTGEFTLAKREADKIVFLLRHRHHDLDNPDPVPFNSNLAEPMERALAGKSGTMIGRDYRGVNVLAAYEPVNVLGFGIVAKMDIVEIRRPFIFSAIKAGTIAVILIVIGAILFNRITNPIIKNLQESKDSLAEAQRIAHMGNWDYDIANNKLVWSDEVYRIFGIEPTGFGAKYEDFLDCVHPDDLVYVKNSMNKAMNKADDYNYNIYFKILRLAGVIRIVHAQGKVTWDSERNPIRMIGTVQDVTERKKAETALQQSEEGFRITFQQAGVGIAHVAPNGQFLKLNKRFCDITGYTEEEMLKLTFQEITHIDDLNADLNLMQQVLDDKIKTYSIEKRYITKDGPIVWVNLTVSLLRETSEEPKYFISVVEDITERKKIQKVLRKAYDELENKVDERTKELSQANIYLEEKNKELERLNKVFVEREFRIKELRDRIKKLEGP